MNRNNVVLVDENDQALGQMDKLSAHQQGLLHRAFSIFIFNGSGELLLQQRAFDKYHGGGLWTNTCCSHPQLGEDLLDSAQERLFFEMGISCQLTFSFSFIYHAEVENNLIEHEYDHVFTGYFSADPIPNPAEAADFRWCPLEEVLADISVHPEHYTYWFKAALPQVINKIQQHGV
ncbi:MAG: isopentenyl-diphosphate delta-isomerase [Sphingobacterium sp.]|jgi:isopentenyl-diphosphate delta-isomerase|nr:isopentenyl-diphosphate delta-isomerase [Sphingobacterium sp.]